MVAMQALQEACIRSRCLAHGGEPLRESPLLQGARLVHVKIPSACPDRGGGRPALLAGPVGTSARDLALCFLHAMAAVPFSVPRRLTEKRDRTAVRPFLSWRGPSPTSPFQTQQALTFWSTCSCPAATRNTGGAPAAQTA
jgi:hypothetical protein